MKNFMLFLFSVCCSTFSIAQLAKISGKITSSSSSAALSGATVFLIEKNKTVLSDQNGFFSFGKLDSGTYSIKCSFSGYSEKIVEDVVVKTGEIITIQISLSEKAITQKEIILQPQRVSVRKESVASLLVAQKNQASVSDFISAQQIRLTPDRLTSDVIKRVSGATIQDDRFAIIRGLNDRYNAAFINGAPLPSSESDRKAFAFDIFPSSILDNLIIYKTATPDKTGEFAGGIIDITTKSILPKKFTSISFGGSYNTLLTGNTRQYSENKGTKDWLGIDDGTRGLPDGWPSAKEIKNLTALKKAELAKSIGSYKWGIKNANAPPNYNFQISQGLNFERNEKEFIGLLAAVNYSRNFTFTQGLRNSYDFDMTNTVYVIPEMRNNYSDSIYNDEVVVSGLLNVSLKINNLNSLSFKNNISINTDNKLIKREGQTDFTSDSAAFIRDAVRWYTTNKIISSQFSGEHTLGKQKTKVQWLASYSDVQREIPSLTRTSYSGFYPDTFNVYGLFVTLPNQTNGSGTFFTTLSKENIKSTKADITQPYKMLGGKDNYIKLGAGYQFRDRSFSSRVLGLVPYSGSGFDFNLFAAPENKIFLPENLGKMANGKYGFMIADGTLPNSDYTASSDLTHAYLMSDQKLFKKIRLIYGVRMEKFTQKLNSVKNLVDTVNLKTTITDFLPSLNFVYSLTSKMNIRLSYSETVNRPEFRELAPFIFFDYVTGLSYEGQEFMKRSKIKNYDFRYEFFPGRAQVFSVSAFQKEFTNPVELVQIPNTSGQVIYINSDRAKVYGIEAEFRTLLSTLIWSAKEDGILSKFSLAGNAAYMKSDVQLGSLFGFTPDKLVTSRALIGQSPYIINGSLNYNDEKSGASATISANRIGDRISIGGTYNLADIYEKGRTIIDFQISKNLLKNKLELRLTGKDLLAQKIDFYFDYDKSKSFTDNDRKFSSYVAPRVISLSVSYKF